IETQSEGDVRKRASCPDDNLARILVHHPNNKICGSLIQRLGVRHTFNQGWNDVRFVIGRAESRRSTRRKLGKVAPASLITKLAVEGFPALGFFLGVQKR